MNSGNLQMRVPSDSLQLNLKYEVFQDPSLQHKKYYAKLKNIDILER